MPYLTAVPQMKGPANYSTARTQADSASFETGCRSWGIGCASLTQTRFWQTSWNSTSSIMARRRSLFLQHWDNPAPIGKTLRAAGRQYSCSAGVKVAH